MNEKARPQRRAFDLGDTMIAENLIDRLNAQAAALMKRAPVLPPRDFPLVLRAEWRIDNCPRMGRLRALAAVAMKPRTARPALYGIAAE